MPSASLGGPTGYSMGRVEWTPSTAKAASRDGAKPTQRSHDGRKASTQSVSMKVAKASLSQMPSHQPMVTRSPNHMWANSWATTSATRSSSARAALFGSTSSAESREVMQPRFSMTPAAKSRMATRSTFSPGYGMLKYSAKKRRAKAPMLRAKSANGRFPGGKTTRSGTASTSTVSVVSSLPTTKATRYVDIFMVGENVTRLLSPTRSTETTGEFENASSSR